MNGEELYQVWSDANDAFDVGVGSWHSLSAEDRDIWDRMAEMLEEGRGS